MTIEVPQSKEIYGGEKDERKKGVGSATHRRRASRGSININE